MRDNVPIRIAYKYVNGSFVVVIWEAITVGNTGDTLEVVIVQAMQNLGLLVFVDQVIRRPDASVTDGWEGM